MFTKHMFIPCLKQFLTKHCGSVMKLRRT